MNKKVNIERIWAMPNKWTFKIKPIAQLLKEEINIDKEIWIDPFAGENSPAQWKNDINNSMNITHNMDALDFLDMWHDVDGVLLDPPYSPRQVSEHYKKAGVKVTGWHTGAGWNALIKDKTAKAIKKGGKCISFGWNTMGLGKNRGFRIERILIVPHGGSKNDTLVTVEIKL